jgi:hypothetical protein
MSHPLRSLRPKGGRKQAFRWTSQQHLNAAAFVRTPFFQQLIGTAAQISEKEILGKLGSTSDELRKSLGFGELSDDAKNEAGQWIWDIVDVKVARLLKTDWDDILGNEEGGGKGEKKDKRSQRSHWRGSAHAACAEEEENETDNEYEDDILEIVESSSKIASISPNRRPSYDEAHTVPSAAKAKARKSKSQPHSQSQPGSKSSATSYYQHETAVSDMRHRSMLSEGVPLVSRPPSFSSSEVPLGQGSKQDFRDADYEPPSSLAGKKNRDSQPLSLLSPLPLPLIADVGGLRNNGEEGRKKATHHHELRRHSQQVNPASSSETFSVEPSRRPPQQPSFEPSPTRQPSQYPQNGSASHSTSQSPPPSRGGEPRKTYVSPLRIPPHPKRTPSTNSSFSMTPSSSRLHPSSLRNTRLRLQGTVQKWSFSRWKESW